MKKKNLEMGLAFAQVVLLLILVLQFNSLKTSISGEAVEKSAPSAAPPSAPTPSVAIDMKTLMDDDPILGDPNAPVTIIEFSDYECPFCGRFYTQTLGQIKSNYIDTGKVNLVYRDFPLGFHVQAMPSAIAANCAGEQDKYYEYHDKIFTNGGSGGKSDIDYLKWAEELNLDIAEWQTCLKDPAQVTEIQKDLSDGSAAGIRGTPGFIINGKLVSGAQPYSVFQQVIEAALNS